jgi:hypothetical protein
MFQTCMLLRQDVTSRRSMHLDVRRSSCPLDHVMRAFASISKKGHAPLKEFAMLLMSLMSSNYGVAISDHVCRIGLESSAIIGRTSVACVAVSVLQYWYTQIHASTAAFEPIVEAATQGMYGFIYVHWGKPSYSDSCVHTNL